MKELIRRLKTQKKAPAIKKNLSDVINKIYLERKKSYSEADYRIRCNLMHPERIVSKINSLYEKSGNKI